MTKTYALRRLLEHGPMTRKQITECTRWPLATVNGAIKSCIDASTIARADFDGKVWSYRSRINDECKRPAQGADAVPV
jgi:hypothetical protein